MSFVNYMAKCKSSKIVLLGRSYSLRAGGYLEPHLLASEALLHFAKDTHHAHESMLSLRLLEVLGRQAIDLPWQAARRTNQFLEIRFCR